MVMKRPPPSMNLLTFSMPCKSMPPRMSSVWSGESPRLGVSADFFHGMGSPRMGAPLTMRCAAHRREQDHVILRPQIGNLLQLLIGDVVVRNVRLVEGDAIPALVLRVRPGMHQGDPRRRVLGRF